MLELYLNSLNTKPELMHRPLGEVALVRCWLRLSPTLLTTQFYLYLWTELKSCCLHSIALPSTTCGEF